MDDKKTDTNEMHLSSEKNSQTEEVLETQEYKSYECFYCDSIIDSEPNLTEHKMKCHGEKMREIQFNSSFPNLSTTTPEPYMNAALADYLHH